MRLLIYAQNVEVHYDSEKILNEQGDSDIRLFHFEFYVINCVSERHFRLLLFLNRLLYILFLN